MLLGTMLFDYLYQRLRFEGLAQQRDIKERQASLDAASQRWRFNWSRLGGVAALLAAVWSAGWLPETLFSQLPTQSGLFAITGLLLLCTGRRG